MTVYKKLIFPILKRFDAESAHNSTIRLVELAQEMALGRILLRKLAGELPQRSVELFGLSFPNELGIAAGFDKDIRIVMGLSLLGFGHIEVGTVTPKPQKGNAQPRVFRLPEDRAIINRMGFPNCGSVEAVTRLQHLGSTQVGAIIGVSIGKQKETPLDNAVNDYKQVMNNVYPYAHYLALNVSSPNTPELRKLQGRGYLKDLLSNLMIENQVLAGKFGIESKPLLLKISPDLTLSELDTILETSEDAGIDGIIATNTTLSRDSLLCGRQEETGGLSGFPLVERSNEIIKHIYTQTSGRMPIIGVGGVFSADDVLAKLKAGATLVQVYTGLVYEGPGMAGRILRLL